MGLWGPNRASRITHHIPHRYNNLTRLENPRRAPPHKNLSSRKELYDSLDELYVLVWPHAATVIRMQKARAACRSTMAMDDAASVGSDLVPMPVTGELDQCAIHALVARSAFGALSRVCVLCSCDTDLLTMADPSQSTAHSQSISRVPPHPRPYPSSLYSLLVCAIAPPQAKHARSPC